MGKLLQISIYAVLLILVFLFFGSMIKSCSNSAVDTITDTTQKVADNIENAGGEIVAKAESVIGESGEEFEGGEIDFSSSDSEKKTYQTENTKPKTPSNATTGSSDKEDYQPSYVVENAKPSPVAKTEKKQPAKEKAKTSSGGSSGRYLLITGNYSQEGNAEQMVKKLRKKGFPNAEHIVFEGSKYYTVIAGKYSSMATANSGKAKLGGIDAYVQKRRD